MIFQATLMKEPASGKYEYCIVNEPRMRKIKPSVAEDRATVCGVESHEHIFTTNTSGILKGHA